MMRRIVNLLKGEVTGRVESGFPERVLNLCAEYGITFWDLNWESPVAFTFTTTRRDWKRLRKLTKRIDCDMTAVSWKGTPFFLGRMRRRVALWGTLAAGVLLLHEYASVTIAYYRRQFRTIVILIASMMLLLPDVWTPGPDSGLSALYNGIYVV